jgi:hypothetical protein
MPDPAPTVVRRLPDAWPRECSKPSRTPAALGTEGVTPAQPIGQSILASSGLQVGKLPTALAWLGEYVGWQTATA